MKSICPKMILHAQFTFSACPEMFLYDSYILFCSLRAHQHNIKYRSFKTRAVNLLPEQWLLVLKFNRTIPNIREVIDEHWHLLQINPKEKNAFQGIPIIAYKRIRNLKEIIGSNKVFNNKVIQKKNAEKKQHFCSPFYKRRDNLCC